MKKAKWARISQCMIVKNEEKNIERALSWGKGVVSEQIVVDTGSSDRTVELAEKMGATVYHYQWNDDFSAAKNFAISKAKYEWIAFLDADEYFPEADGKKLLQILDMLREYDAQAVVTGLVNLDDDGSIISVDSHIRIFKNLPELRYKNRIHEFLSKNGKKIPAWDAVKELTIFHTGYGKSIVKEKQDEGRNFRMIRAELAEHPDNYEMWAYLGNEYTASKEWDNAEDAYRKAVLHMPEEMKGNYSVTTSETHFRLLERIASHEVVNKAELLQAYQKAAEGWPEEGDYDYLMSRFYMGNHCYQEGEKFIRLGLEKLEKYGSTFKSGTLSARITEAYEMLAICCYHNGKPQECVQAATAVLKENPYMANTVMILVSAFRDDMRKAGKGWDGAVQVASFLERSFYHFDSIKDKALILKVAETVDYPELAQVMRELFSPQELQQLKG